MAYVLHIAMSIDKAVLHRDRCLEVPQNITHQDHWTGVWQEVIDKDGAITYWMGYGAERAYEALDLSQARYKLKCVLCKP